MDYLAKKNPHIRDNDISFEEGPHIYTIKGERNTHTSVTTWVHSFFPKFDADEAIRKKRKSKNWIKDPLYGKTDKEIKAVWEANRDDAATKGTKMHYDIECFYNEQPSKENDSIEYKHFLKFAADYAHLKPYRTEWMVFHEEMKLAGSIDMVFENPDGTLQIFDWKRCKELRFVNTWQQAIPSCLGHLDDTNYSHYSLQLNIYKVILEQKYDKKITGLFLVVLHPNNESYKVVEVRDLQEDVHQLFDLRQMQLENDKLLRNAK
jgi:ATP-dependent exoDNAse (exonuclease V) beta subunit